MPDRPPETLVVVSPPERELLLPLDIPIVAGSVAASPFVNLHEVDIFQDRDRAAARGDGDTRCEINTSMISSKGR